MSDLNTWITTTAGIVITQVPLQSRSSAIILVEAWLSDIGGWVPDVPTNPTGEGAPENGFTEQQAANDITNQQYRSVYDLNFQATVKLSVQLAAKFSEGLSLADAAVAMSNQLEDFLTDSINESTLPLRLDVVTTQAAQSNRSVLGGYTTPPIRVAIAADAAAVKKLVDYKAMTLRYAQQTYGLNNTWNIVSVFTQPNDPISIRIQKYTSNTYVDLDIATTQIYVFTISPETYGIVSGVIVNQT